MDPNAVVIGGTALAAASAIGGVSLLSPQVLGVGLLGLTTLGGSALMATGVCPPGFCQVRTKKRFINLKVFLQYFERNNRERNQIE